MKPIEPGCLAMIVSCGVREDLGKTVVVGNYIGKPNIKISNDPRLHQCWEVSPPVAWIIGGSRVKRRPVCPEAALLRIDGYETEQDVKQEVTA